jgi:ferredoxin
MYRRQTAAYFTAVGLLLLLRRCFILDRMINHCGPIILCFLSLLSLSVGWRVTFPLRSGYRLARFAPRHSFDPSKSWDVKLCFNGEEKTVNVHEDQVLLEAAESVFIDPPFGCRQGVCYACTAQVLTTPFATRGENISHITFDR